MEKEQIEKLKQMLGSKDLDDINLAGEMIKNVLLKISDEDLKQFWTLIDTLSANPNRPPQSQIEMLRDLLKADIHQSEGYSGWTAPISKEWINPPYYTGTLPYVTGDVTMDSTGTLTTNC